MHDYLKAKDLLFVLFDRGCGFFVMTKSTYSEKFEDVLNSDQFRKINGVKLENVIKPKKQISNGLQQLMKQGKKDDEIYQRRVDNIF